MPACGTWAAVSAPARESPSSSTPPAVTRGAPGVRRPGITVEHYAVSTGLRPMIEGSPIAPYLDGIWANTLVEHTAPPGYLGRPPCPGAGGSPARGW